MQELELAYSQSQYRHLTLAPSILQMYSRYEVLYNQLGVSRLEEFAKLGLLDHKKVITMKVGHQAEIRLHP